MVETRDDTYLFVLHHFDHLVLPYVAAANRIEINMNIGYPFRASFVKKQWRTQGFVSLIPPGNFEYILITLIKRKSLNYCSFQNFYLFSCVLVPLDLN